MIGRTCATERRSANGPDKKIPQVDRGREEQVKAKYQGQGGARTCPSRAHRGDRDKSPGEVGQADLDLEVVECGPPRSHFIRAASEACRIECRTNETTPSMPTASRATGLIASAPPALNRTKPKISPTAPITFPTIIAIAAGLGSAVVRVVGVPVVSSWSVMVVAPCLRILIGGTELIYGLRSTSELVVGACRDRTCSCRWKIR